MKIKRYWLRGGVILVLIALVTLIPILVTLFYPKDYDGTLLGALSSYSIFMHVPVLVLLMGNAMQPNSAPVQSQIPAIVIAAIISLAMYFGVGCFFGYLYNKSKKWFWIIFAVFVFYTVKKLLLKI